MEQPKCKLCGSLSLDIATEEEYAFIECLDCGASGQKVDMTKNYGWENIKDVCWELWDYYSVDAELNSKKKGV